MGIVTKIKVKTKDLVIGLDNRGDDVHKQIKERNLKYSYKFDNKGNWTSCTYSLNEVPIVLVKREIEYF